MKVYQKLFLSIFLATISICGNAQNADCCQYLIEILNIEKISTHLKLNDNELKTIRIIDRNKLFANCRCEKRYWQIGVVKEIPVDINTGRSIDFVILKGKKKRKTLELTFFYSLSGQLQMPNLWSGEIKIKKTNDGLIIEDFRIYNIQ